MPKSKVVLLNKPFNTLCQFTDSESRPTLKDCVDIPGVYAAGRLDKDSEGLVILTDDGRLQHKISHPKHKEEKAYWVQVEGEIDEEALVKLSRGVQLKDGKTRPAKAVKILPPEGLWERVPPIRERKHIPTSWLELRLKEGKNRQVRRMTAAVGFPTLRLIRHQIGKWQLGGLQPGEYRVEEHT